MSNREKRIRSAIRKDGRYLSSETGQLWIVRETGRQGNADQRFVIKHQHPKRNLHIQCYAATRESAVKKIVKHEEWTLEHRR